jgi:hypothetical protein
MEDAFECQTRLPAQVEIDPEGIAYFVFLDRLRSTFGRKPGRNLAQNFPCTLRIQVVLASKANGFNGTYGRGGGDRTLSTQLPKSLNHFTREHRFGATWGQKVCHLLQCRT